MSIQALQEFIGRHMVSAGALTAVAAALDAKAGGAPLDPMLAIRIQEFLDTLGASDLLNEIGPQAAATMRSMVRAMYLLDSKLLSSHRRTGVWNHLEPQILQSIGETSRLHALEVTRSVVPACDGLPNRFHAPGAAMLDIGVGVAGSAIAMAQMWPELRIVGIDPWQPALRLARENVDRAGLGARFDLREQGVETLDDRAAFDLAWFATHFIPERYVRPGLARTLNALRPGGWIMAGANNDAAAPEMSALSRLRMAQWGGPVWSARDVEKALYDAGFVDVRSLPTRPEALAALVIGRRRPV